jgi:hypothetical protein
MVKLSFTSAAYTYEDVSEYAIDFSRLDNYLLFIVDQNIIRPAFETVITIAFYFTYLQNTI